MSQLEVNGLSSSPVRPTGLSFDPGLTPWGEPGHHYGPSSPVRLFCRSHEGCQSVSRPVPWAYVLGLWAAFILGTINIKLYFFILHTLNLNYIIIIKVKGFHT